MRLVVDKSPASSQVALDQIVVNDLAALHFFRPALFDSILVAGSELTLDLAAQLAQLLKPGSSPISLKMPCSLSRTPRWTPSFSS